MYSASNPVSSRSERKRKPPSEGVSKLKVLAAKLPEDNSQIYKDGFVVNAQIGCGTLLSRCVKLNV